MKKWDPTIDRLKKDPPANLRTEPVKNACKPETLSELANEMERHQGYMWAAINEDADTDLKKFTIRRHKEVMLLADALLRMAIENRFIYHHDLEVLQLEKLGTRNDDELAPLWDRANHLLELIKQKRFVEYDDWFGEEVEKYIKTLEVKAWIKKAKEGTKRMRRLRREMFYVDHEAYEIEKWKESYYESSVKIERHALLCLKAILPVVGEQEWTSFDEFVAAATSE